MSYIDYFEGTGDNDFFEGGDGNDTLIGHGGNDSLFGFEGDDLLIGGEGNDALDGGGGVDTASYAASTANVNANLATGAGGGDDAGADTLTGIENIIGGSGNDFLRGDAGANLFVGGDGHDILFSLAGNDTLQGGDGDDALAAGVGDNLVDGGDGIDRVVITGGTAGITVDLRIQGVAQATGIGDYTLISIEQASATRYDDVLIGDDADNWLWGGSDGSGETGDDTISGLAGDDLIQIGSGNHLVAGGDGMDALSFQGNSSDFTTGVTVSLALQGAAQDTGQGLMTLSDFENLSGTAFADTLTGDAGDNVLAGYGGGNFLSGGDGDDTLRSNGSIRANTHNVGSAGPITVFAVDGDGADTLDGGSGDDLLDGGGSNDMIDGGEGVDTVTYADAASSVNVNLAFGTASGSSSGVDTLSHIENVVGSAFNDSLTGDAGDNVLIGGAGNDTLDGGEGIDTAVYVTAASAVNVNLNSGTVSGGGGVDTLLDIENIIGSDHDDTLTGDDGDNLLAGGEGDDTLQGRGGVDTLSGGLGDDVLDGGGDGSTASFSNPDDIGVIVDLELGVASGLGSDTLSGFANVIGSGGNDVLTGDDADNILWAGDGAVSGDDTINGGSGDDLVIVGSGNHYLDSGTDLDGDSEGGGEDTVSFADVAAGVTVSLGQQGQVQDTGQGQMTLLGFAQLAGSAFADTLSGSASDDNLFGGAGGDSLSGGDGDDGLFADAVIGAVDGSTDWIDVADPGADTLDGGAGNDELRGGDGGDLLIGGDGDDYLVSYGSEDDIDLDGDNTLSGGAGDDEMEGGAGDDIFDGGDGNDTVWGLSGSDTLTGGEGLDVLWVGSGDPEDWTVVELGNGRFEVTRGNDSTVLSGVEELRYDFTGDLLYDLNVSPTGANNASVSLRIGATKVFATSDFGFSDLDGDALQGVIVDALPSSGALTLDGVAVTAGQTVSAADIAAGKLMFNATAVGTPTFSFRVQDDGGGFGDGIDMGANVFGITVTAAPSPPPAPSTPPVITSGTAGTTGNDVATFGATNEIFSAGLGADTVSGGGGNDWLQGNAGDDTLSGGVGDDIVYGGKDNDVLTGDAGDDNLFGDAGDDTVNGGLGNDSVQGGEGSNYLRGDEGNDAVTGGSGFDNLHGNAGDDTVSGGLGDDWVAGGKDDDVVSGGEGGDVVTGDLGDDVVSGNQGGDLLDGGVGDDIVRGGQGDDIVRGGDGDDYVSGDRGADTISGGTGADLFHTSSDAGVDRVLDFNQAEGDRILLDPGTVYTTAQVGADVVITLSGGEMTLVGVQLSSLTEGWILGA